MCLWMLDYVLFLVCLVLSRLSGALLVSSLSE